MRQQPTVEIRCAYHSQRTLDRYDQGTFFVFEGRDHPYIIISVRYSRMRNQPPSRGENMQVWYVSMKTGTLYKINRSEAQRKMVRIIEPVHLSFAEVE